MKKRVFTVILALILVVILITTTAFASDSFYLKGTEEGKTIATASDPDTPSGTFGDGLSWSLDSDGVLTISGEGTIPGYASGSHAPWGKHIDSIKKVIFTSGITEIGDHVFESCTGITDISIPNSVTEIGAGVFRGCTGLKTVMIPGSVTKIGENSFKMCTGLTTVIILEGVSIIADAAFANCTGLTQVTIPDSLTVIDSNAFKGCTSLSTVIGGKNVNLLGNDVFDDTPWFTSQGDFCKIGEVLIKYRGEDSEVTIPNNITIIGERAFLGCKTITTVVIPDSVTSIGTGAFCLCTNLATVEITDSVADYGTQVFYGTPWYNGLGECPTVHGHLLGYNGTDEDVVIPSGVTSIESGAFYGDILDTRINSVTIPDSVKKIKEEAFLYSTIKRITIGNGVENIENRAFYECVALTSIVLPNSVESVGEWTFAYCEKLESVTFGTGIKSIGDEAFYDCMKLESVSFGTGIKCIGDMAFYKCVALTSIVLPNSVESVGDKAFSECTKLESVTFGTGIKSIGQEAFYYCNALTSIQYLGSENQWKFVEGIEQFDEVKIEFHNTNMKIDIYGVSLSLEDLIKINVYASVDESGANETYITANGGLLEWSDGTGLTSETATYENAKQNGSVILGFMTKNENDKAMFVQQSNGIMPTEYSRQFYFRAYLKISENVYIYSELLHYSIEDYCTETQKDSASMEELKKLCASILAYGNDATVYSAVKKMAAALVTTTDFASEDVVLNGKEGEKSLNVAGDTDTPSGTFGNGLGWALDSDGVLTISGEGSTPAYYESGSDAPWSEYKDSIKKVIFTSGITGIGERIFQNCTGITEVLIPNSVIELGIRAFYGCTGLNTVTIPGSVTEIGEEAFAKCTGLTKVIISEGVSIIGQEAFSDCTKLTQVTIPDSVTTINNAAFNECTSLLTVIGGQNINKLGEGVFNDTPWLASQGDFAQIGVILVKYNGDDSEVTIPNGITSICLGAFAGCEAIASVVIPNSVTSIGMGAFGACTNLTSVSIPNSVTDFGMGAFFGTPWYNNLGEFPTVHGHLLGYNGTEEDVVIPSGVTSIESAAFCGDIQAATINSVTIPDSVKTIKDEAFRSNTIQRITIGNGVENIGNQAFYECKSLTSILLPNSVESVGEMAFYGCTKLEGVTFGTGIKSIGDKAFYECVALTSILLPNSVEVVGDEAFYGCKKLEGVTFGTGIKSIGDGAFYKCEALTSIVLPNSVEVVGDEAFYGCIKLERVTFGTGIKIIGDGAFLSCSALTSVHYLGSEMQWKFVEGIEQFGEIKTEFHNENITIEICGALSLEDLFKINVFATIDSEGVNEAYITANGGLLEWSDGTGLTSETATHENAGKNGSVISGLMTKTENDKTIFVQQSNGIMPTEYNKQFYFRAYVKVSEDVYIYSKLLNYSIEDYCTEIQKDSASIAELKKLCASIMTYGNDARAYFAAKESELE